MLLGHMLVKVRYRAERHAILGLHHGHLALRRGTVGHTVLKDGLAVQARIGANTGVAGV